MSDEKISLKDVIIRDSFGTKVDTLGEELSVEFVLNNTWEYVGGWSGEWNPLEETSQAMLIASERGASIHIPGKRGGVWTRVVLGSYEVSVKEEDPKGGVRKAISIAAALYYDSLPEVVK